MTLSQPTAFSSPLKRRDGEHPCCRRRFRDAGWCGRLGRFPPSDPSFRVGERETHALVESGRLSEWMRPSATLEQPAVLEDAEEVEDLRAAVASHEASPAPFIDHPSFGPIPAVTSPEGGGPRPP